MKINQLLEAKGRYYIHRADDYVVSITGASFPPQIVVFATDTYPINESSHLVAVRFNRAKFKDYMYAGNGIRKSQVSIDINLWNKVLRFFNKVQLLDSIDEFDAFCFNFNNAKAELEKAGVIKSYNFSNVSDLAKWLTLTMKFEPEKVKSITNMNFTDHVKSDTFVGKTEVIFPDTMRKSRVDEITTLIKAANGIIIKHGLGVITDVKMLVVPIPGNVIGLYYNNTKHIKICPSAKATKSALNTILHEYGHKWYYEQMTEEQRNQVKEKYLENLSSQPANVNEIPQERMAEIAQRGLAVKKIVQDLKVGDTIDYAGRKTSFKKLTPFVIEEISLTTMKIRSIANRGLLHGSPAHFVDKGFSKDGKMLSSGIESKVIEPVVHDNWFPSQYSKKNESEWFAEIFAFWMEDKLTNPEVVGFLKPLLNK